MPAAPHLADDLRALIEHARRAGADAAWLDRVAGELVDVLLERTDPRRRDSLSRARRLADRAAAMHRLGHDRAAVLAALRETSGLSASQVRRLLSIARAHDFVRARRG